MCGKFTQRIVWRNVVYLSELFGIALSDGALETVTPMRFAKVVALDGNGVRRSVPMRWGLIAPYAKDGPAVTRHIHARAETIDTLPTFRDAFANRRGILIASTFNEGKEITPSKTEQHVLTPADGKAVAIAVIWERGETALLTFAMVTTPANALIGTITDRMPALLEETDWPKWLGEEEASIAELKALLKISERDLNMEKAAKPAPPPKPKKTSDQRELF